MGVVPETSSFTTCHCDRNLCFDFIFAGRQSALMVTPMWLPVLVQTMRIVVEVSLWQMHREGNVPVQFTIEGRNFDLFIGLSAHWLLWESEENGSVLRY